jgi:hypothetical protein
MEQPKNHARHTGTQITIFMLSFLRAPRPPTGFFSSERRYSVQPRSRFLVFPRNRPLIYPESPSHPPPPPPGCARGLWTREKRVQTRSVDERTCEPHFLVANPPPLLLLCRRRHHPSPIRWPVACTPPSLLPPTYILSSVVSSAYILPSGNSSRHASSTPQTGVRPFAWAHVDPSLPVRLVRGEGH